MYKISLVNMPFAVLNVPSLALTQLESVLHDRNRGQLAIDVLYLNHDFAHYIGADFYQRIVVSTDTLVSGLGEWFFRQSAFPDAPDNSDDYFLRYYSGRDEQTQMFKRLIVEKRQGIDDFLNELIVRYRLDDVDLVGFTSTFSQNVASLALARKLKERNPNVITVMGGANCESPMGQELIRHVEHLDFVFSGPALKSFPEFVQYHLDHDIEKCNRINGVFSKANLQPWHPLERSGERGPFEAFKSVGPRGDELDIDAKVDLDYGPFLDTFERNFPKGDVELILQFETSRGCWWGERMQCTFCGVNGSAMRYRTMSPERALEQFRSLFQYTDRCLRLQAVDNILPKNYVTEVFPFLETPPDALIFYETKADISEKDIQAMSAAGVRVIQPGIEALATSVLRLMKKGTTVFQNLFLLRTCPMYDVYPAWNLLVGFPGEEEEVYRKYLRDIPLLMHLPPPTGVYPVRFERYSPYFDRSEEYGLDLRPYDFYELTYPFGEEVAARLAYYFVDMGAEYLMTMAEWIEPIAEQCDLWWRRWHGDDGRLPARLFLKEAEWPNTVYDSRSGELVEHHIGDVGRQVLEELSKPRKADDLAKVLGHIEGFDVEKEVRLLQDRGLVFQEGDRFLNLVFAKEPPPMKFKGKSLQLGRTLHTEGEG